MDKELRADLLDCRRALIETFDFVPEGRIVNVIDRAVAALTAQERPRLPDGYSVDVDELDCITVYHKGNVVSHVFPDDDLHPFFEAFLEPTAEKPGQFKRKWVTGIGVYWSDDTRTGPEDRRLSAMGLEETDARPATAFCRGENHHIYGRRHADRARWTIPQSVLEKGCFYDFRWHPEAGGTCAKCGEENDPIPAPATPQPAPENETLVKEPHVESLRKLQQELIVTAGRMRGEATKCGEWVGAIEHLLSDRRIGGKS